MQKSTYMQALISNQKAFLYDNTAIFVHVKTLNSFSMNEVVATLLGKNTAPYSPSSSHLVGVHAQQTLALCIHQYISLTLLSPEWF
jgi:hypothetical protein